VLLMDHFYQLADARGTGRADARGVHGARALASADREHPALDVGHRQHLPATRRLLAKVITTLDVIQWRTAILGLGAAGSNSNTSSSASNSTRSRAIEKLEEALQIIVR